ncbi:MAG: pantetheine-phosphate adenylyltransferase [Crenarchaeota archaeon]|nr:MAG: pantetheine-phosphate adenylyltransferase [Thermoproteota archaeon]RDJ33113.1 MAG: pantetheine-phosphate adenylyltransferase [Thermoproteota archaeon]RDJ36383.1 MAG: pantetheine-phosphate adenylyltransferase [Thermoproteota archaeon]RDJ39013.1 MAG: pantetheine-phosphate adenylyltransferase [Thermoproteota archaeon]
MKKFNLVATGGTFDIVHKGHLALLEKAFSVSSGVIIGLTSDEFAIQKGKKTLNDFETRKINLKSIIEKTFPNSKYQISKLDNDFGPAVLEKDVEALVTSQETSYQGNNLNKLRQEKNMPPIETIVVPMILAGDGKRISTTRIRNSEIDSEGNLS